MDSSLEVLRLGVLMIMGSKNSSACSRKIPRNSASPFFSYPQLVQMSIIFFLVDFSSDFHCTEAKCNAEDPHWAPQKGDFRLASYSHGEFHRIFHWNYTKHGGNFHGGGYNYTMMFVCLGNIKNPNMQFDMSLSFFVIQKRIIRGTWRTSSNSLTSSGFRGHGRKETGTKDIQNGAHLSGCNCHGSSMVNYCHIFNWVQDFFCPSTTYIWGQNMIHDS